jgi:hypothetical protein
MDISSLPEIVETKETLAGVRKEFRCRELARADGGLVVLFVSDRAYTVHGLSLPVGTVTFGHFWTDRPYNVYHWMTPAGETLAHYFNISEATTLEGQALSWRDLTVDLLVRPGTAPVVLDEDELPAGLPPDVRAAIDAATATALREAETVVAVLEARAGVLWHGLTGSPRP